MARLHRCHQDGDTKSSGGVRGGLLLEAAATALLPLAVLASSIGLLSPPQDGGDPVWLHRVG